MELRFQREANRHSYMTWETIRKRVDPEKRYKVRDAQTWEIMNGAEILDTTLRLIHNGRCSMIARLQEAPPGEEIPLVRAWAMPGTSDPETGKALVLGWDQDQWDLRWLTEKPAHNRHELDSDLLMATASQIATERTREERHWDLSIIEEALPDVAAAFQAGYHRNMEIGRTREAAMTIALANANEALDRSYNLERMRRAGVDLDRYPWFRTMQAYFDLGMKPPSHREMADAIIRLHGAEEEGTSEPRREGDAP